MNNNEQLSWNIEVQTTKALTHLCWAGFAGLFCETGPFSLVRISFNQFWETEISQIVAETSCINGQVKNVLVHFNYEGHSILQESDFPHLDTLFGIVCV